MLLNSSWYMNSTFTSSDEEHIIEIRIFAVIFLMIFITGIFGNALVVYVFAKNKTIRTITNIFLLNLAIVDLVYLVLCCPFITAKVYLSYWPFGNALCKLVTYAMVVCMSVNVMSLEATGVDRYLAVIHPVKSRPYRKKRNIYIILMCLWTLSLTCFTPIFAMTTEIRIFRSHCIERMDEHSRMVYAISMFVIFYAFPQAILGFCYTSIACKLWSFQRPGNQMNQVAVVCLKIKFKLFKLTFLVSMAFVVCWLPMHVAAILSAVGTNSYYLQLFAPCFAYATVSLNPIIYCFMSKAFRKCLKAAIMCVNLQFTRPWLAEGADEINQNRIPLRYMNGK